MTHLLESTQKSLKRKTEETSLIELVNNIFVSGQELGENVNTKYPSKVESEKVSITKKRRNKIGEKVMYSSDKNHQDVESEVLSECNTIESKKKGTPKREGTRDKMSKVNAEVTLSNCKYCPFKIPGRKYFKAKLRMHNKTKHFVCVLGNLVSPFEFQATFKLISPSQPTKLVADTVLAKVPPSATRATTR